MTITEWLQEGFEKAFPGVELPEIKDALERAGFELLGVWSDFDFTAPEEHTERWYFAARAKKNT